MIDERHTPAQPRAHTTGETESTPPERSRWRQGLVELERGVTLGIRSDAAMFVLAFGVVTTALAGLVVGLSLAHWIAIVLAFTVVLVSGMFNQVLKTVWNDLGHHFAETALAAYRIGRAAVHVAAIGGVTVVVLVFVDHFLRLFDG